MASRNTNTRKTPEVCPVCGEEVPRGAQACPECGADERSGWREEMEVYDGTDVPAEGFNYDEFVREEFGTSPKPSGIKLIWWITAILLFGAMAVIYFRGGR